MTDVPTWTMTEDDVLADTWFERDRQMVVLYLRVSADDRDYGPALQEWWDEDVSAAVDDGFLKARDWRGSGFAYLKDQGAVAALEEKVRTFLSGSWSTLTTDAKAAFEASEDLEAHARLAVDLSRLGLYGDKALPWSVVETIGEAYEAIRDDVEEARDAEAEAAPTAGM